jgi:hypothetical protein
MAGLAGERIGIVEGMQRGALQQHCDLYYYTVSASRVNPIWS